MDPRHFDHLATSLVEYPTRRRLMGVLSALPLGGVLTWLGPEETDAHGRRHRRRVKSHKHGKGRHRKDRKKNKQKKACNPACPAGQTCKGGVCGVTCGSAFCPAATEICASGSCQACTVCATCSQTTLQAAIDAASNGGTVSICAGTYTRSGVMPVGLISLKNLTLRGAGAGSTILDGADVESSLPVLLLDRTTTQLLDLTVTGSNGYSGIVTTETSTVTLENVSVTGNHQTALNRGGGIFNQATLTLKQGTIISENTAGDGAGVFNNPTGILNVQTGSSITKNTASGLGGGVYNFTGGQVNRAGGTITENTPTNCVNFDGTAC